MLRATSLKQKEAEEEVEEVKGEKQHYFGDVLSLPREAAEFVMMSDLVSSTSEMMKYDPGRPV